MSDIAGFYPLTPAIRSGFLKVSDKPSHELFWHEFGNPRGAPVFVLHGGPGGGSVATDVRYFDPDYYRIIMFDQRGAGQSKPFASLENNTTRDLVDDITRLRDYLGVTGKMHVFGGSWGSTLALVYAINYPETVSTMTLRGIFLCRAQDIEVFYQGDAASPGNPALQGSGRFFPEAWKQYVEFIPEAERGNMVSAYHRRLTGDDEQVRLEAARRWSIWEMTTCMLQVDPELVVKGSDPSFALPFARIENHYFMNGAFLNSTNSRDQNYIIDSIARIASIPTEIVHGRYDMVCPLNQATDLVKAWQGAQPDSALWPKLHIVEGAGHSAREPGIAAKLREVSDRFRKLQN